MPLLKEIYKELIQERDNLGKAFWKLRKELPWSYGLQEKIDETHAKIIRLDKEIKNKFIDSAVSTPPNPQYKWMGEEDENTLRFAIRDRMKVINDIEELDRIFQENGHFEHDPIRKAEIIEKYRSKVEERKKSAEKIDDFFDAHPNIEKERHPAFGKWK